MLSLPLREPLSLLLDVGARIAAHVRIDKHVSCLLRHFGRAAKLCPLVTACKKFAEAFNAHAAVLFLCHQTDKSFEFIAAHARLSFQALGRYLILRGKACGKFFE